MLHEHEFLIAQGGIHRVDGQDLRDGLNGLRHFGFGKLNAGCGVLRAFPQKGCWITSFPPGSGIKARVHSQRALQHGGAGARQADNDQRVVDLNLMDLREALEIVLHDESVDELANQSFTHHHQTRSG